MSTKTPKYAIRLAFIFVTAIVLFFAGLQLFVPAGSKATGSYDAKSLQYIAAAPVKYNGSTSCNNCHSAIFEKWQSGAHGARAEKSNCEVCHGPGGTHPKGQELKKVRGDGDLVQLCLVCHRQMQARKTTGQPQIDPYQHPVPTEAIKVCVNCHDPHAPGFKTVKSLDPTKVEPEVKPEVIPESKSKAASRASDPKGGGIDGGVLAAGCFSCHGKEGQGGFAPALAGQSFSTLVNKLEQFKTGKLRGAMMNPIAQKMTEQDIKGIATYFSQQR